MANMKIEQIEGIGPTYAQKLKTVQIEDTDALLDRCHTSKGRDEVAQITGITRKLILKWTNMADLCRIKGVGEEFSELLERAGVDTVKELRNRRPDNLCKKMEEVNAEKHLTRRNPSLKEVTRWVEEAKELPPKLEY